MSHFKHNPDKRGTLASEPGSSPMAEQDQHASLWTNTKRPPRPARGSKRRSNGYQPCYSYLDEYDDDDEELVFIKEERSSDTTDTTKLAGAGSAYHLRTHNTNISPASNTKEFHEFDGRSRKRPAPDSYHATSCGQRAALRVCFIFSLYCSTSVSLTPKSHHTCLSLLRNRSPRVFRVRLSAIHPRSVHSEARTIHWRIYNSLFTSTGRMTLLA